MRRRRRRRFIRIGTSADSRSGILFRFRTFSASARVGTSIASVQREVRPAEPALAYHIPVVISYGMKMTLYIDQKKVEEAMAEYGVATKTEVIDLALRELLRKKAVDRLMGSIGKFPQMVTNEELEASEKRHLNRARRR